MVQKIYAQLAAATRPFALALIAGTKGSSPQRTGAKAMFFADSKIIGTLGGGCLEAEVQLRALRALKNGQPAQFEIVLDHVFGWDDGLICGGSVNGLILPNAERAVHIWRKLASVSEPIRWGVREDFSIALQEASPIGSLSDNLQTNDGSCGATSLKGEWLYQESVAPPMELWIAGSGHVAQALVPLAQQLDFSVTLFDDRPEFANHHFFPLATKLRVSGWHELLKISPPTSPAFGVIVTRGHQHDALVLSDWIRFPFAFLGMIGSRRKARIMREQFIKQDIATSDQFDRVSCPVGLDISAVGTQEIAVSVMAQLIQKRAAIKEKIG